MEFIPEDMIEDVKEGFSESIEALVNVLGVKLGRIAENTKSMARIQEIGVNKLCMEVEKGVTASDEFRLHCEVLLAEFEGVEELASQIRMMRKNCEELERVLGRVKGVN